MISKIPIIDSWLSFRDILFALKMSRKDSLGQEFRLKISRLLGLENIYFTDSGLSAFFIILNALKENSKKREVVLPAYTAGSLVTAVIKAGLKPVLCDISLKDFNLEVNGLEKSVSGETLAVICVHLFGIGTEDIAGLKAKLASGVLLIEDCAQAMGSKITEKQVGSFADISFFSFNRGKNLPLCSGGCIATNSEIWSASLSRQIEQLADPGLFSKTLIPLKILAISLAVNPFIYGLGFPLISLFKDDSPLVNIRPRKFTAFQAGLGLALLSRTESFFKSRFQNGKFLLDNLKDKEGIIVPDISSRSQPVFNRFPVVFEDPEKKEKIKQKLWKLGIEASEMYLRPVHQMFDLGYKLEEFPQANYLASHLLTLPVHSSIRQEDLEIMIKVILA